jgi:threonine dehydrogenase-like Zn-dependent dehydrogenase
MSAFEVPSSCRAALLVEPGKPMEIGEVQVPDVLERGALLVQTTAATVCATDVHLWEGAVGSKDAGADLPLILGHEMTGRIVRMADDADRDSLGQPLAIGDRIIWTHGFCGQCEQCVIEHQPTLCTNRRGYMQTAASRYPYLTGGFAEYCYVFPTSGRMKVPDTVSDPVASAASCALRTVVHAFDRTGPIEERQTVLVQGAGPLGLFSVAKAAAVSPAQLIVVGGPEVRLALARSWGATETIDIGLVPDPQERIARVQELTGGRGADVVLEMSGVPAAFAEGMAMLRPGGRYTVVGQVHTKSLPFNPSMLVMKHARVTGCLSAGFEHYYRGLRFLDQQRSRFHWDDMITSAQPLDDINDAFLRMRDWREIKPAITFATAEPMRRSH